MADEEKDFGDKGVLELLKLASLGVVAIPYYVAIALWQIARVIVLPVVILAAVGDIFREDFLEDDSNVR